MSTRRFWFALIATAAGTASAATHHVSTPEQFDRAVREASPGDTLVMRNGTWTDTRLRLLGQGRPDAPIVLRAESRGKVILTGTSRLEIGGSHLVVDGLLFRGDAQRPEERARCTISFQADGVSAQHCRVTRCSVIDFNPPNKLTNTRWVGMHGIRNRLDHCRFENKTNIGTTLDVWLDDPPHDRANHHRIDHNYFYLRPLVGRNGAETIRIGTSTRSMQNSRTLVEHNVFEKCDGEHELISNKSCENVYRGNTIIECAGLLTLRHGNRCLVDSNFFFGRGAKKTGGLRVMGEDHRIVNNLFVDLAAEPYYAAISFMNGIPNSPLNGYLRVKNCEVAFNTFINIRYILNSGGNTSKATLPPKDCRIANNLFVGRQSQFTSWISVPENLEFVGNIAYGVAFDGSAPQGVRLADPKLKPSSDGHWRPALDSPAIGAAIGDWPEIATDVDGQPRPTQKTVGSDEPSEAPIRNRPLAPQEVGPETLGDARPRMP